MAFDLLSKKTTARDWSCGAADVGSMLFPEKEQKALGNKIDDVRFDVRRAGARMSGAVYALAGAVSALATVKLYKYARGVGLKKEKA
jgi:hypothetical protein